MAISTQSGDRQGSLRRGPALILGTDSGALKIYPWEKHDSGYCFDMRCSSSIDASRSCVQALLVKDISASGVASEQIVLGNLAGELFVFLDGQLFSSSKLSRPISLLCQERYQNGEVSIVAGDFRGNLASFFPDASWQINLREFSLSHTSGGDEQSSKTEFELQEADSQCESVTRFHFDFDPKPRCAMTVNFRDPGGCACSYLLVAYGRPELLLLSGGKLFHKISTPTVINSICLGSFTSMG